MPNVGKLSQPKPKKKKKSLRKRASERLARTKIGGKIVSRRINKQLKKDFKGKNVGIGVSGEKPAKKKSRFQLTGRPKTKTYKEKNVGVEKTKGGKYPTYKKGGKAGTSFKSKFASSCKGGASGFTWQGRKYSCAKK